MELIKKAKWGYLFLSALYIVLGIILIVYPAQTINVICKIIGVTAVAAGIYTIVRFFLRSAATFTATAGLITGIICLVCGILLISNPDFIKSIFPFVIGIMIIIDSAFKLSASLELRGTSAGAWYGMFFLALLGLIFGFVVVFNARVAADLITRIIGVSLIVDAVENICAVATVSGKVRAIAKKMSKDTVEGEFTEIKTERTDNSSDSGTDNK